MDHRGFGPIAIILTIVVVILIVGGVWFSLQKRVVPDQPAFQASVTPESIATGSTYQNALWRYSVSYPQAWHVAEFYSKAYLALQNFNSFLSKINCTGTDSVNVINTCLQRYATKNAVTIQHIYDQLNAEEATWKAENSPFIALTNLTTSDEATFSQGLLTGSTTPDGFPKNHLISIYPIDESTILKNDTASKDFIMKILTLPSGLQVEETDSRALSWGNLAVAIPYSGYYVMAFDDGSTSTAKALIVNTNAEIDDMTEATFYGVLNSFTFH